VQVSSTAWVTNWIAGNQVGELKDPVGLQLAPKIAFALGATTSGCAKK
jgi:hypothetical protein